ncbi:hypothetical protein OEZ85_002511 [Tetradesmus obliquus]|uniref:Uncharacterized protein n=1 Tax=Tetradesmus obliquus TaxID=3088 RepID=A0ABY8U0D8_TETOB|nr:hypothetical protein OEZ85_002511 [Tetradesmus obliquus]
MATTGASLDSQKGPEKKAQALSGPVRSRLTWLSLAVSPYSGAAQLALGREDLLLLAPLRKLARLDFVGFFSPDAVQELWDAELKQWRQQQA